jgi:hypothetical protein
MEQQQQRVCSGLSGTAALSGLSEPSKQSGLEWQCVAAMVTHQGSVERDWPVSEHVRVHMPPADANAACMVGLFLHTLHAQTLTEAHAQ